MEPIKIFIAFAAEDRAEKEKVSKFFAPMSRLRNIVLWDESKIDPGQQVEAIIEGQLLSANIVLLLLSVESLNTPFFYEKIVRLSLARNEKKECEVVPVILNHCGWRDTPLGKLKPLPANGTPVVDWKPETLALQEIANGINTLIDRLESRRKFDNEINLGKQAFENAAFREALTAFNEAILCYQAGFEPNEIEIKSLIAKCNTAEQQEFQQQENLLRQIKFTKVVKQARQIASKGLWEESKKLYQEAQGLFYPGYLPNEQQIHNEIAQCDHEIEMLLNDRRNQKAAAAATMPSENDKAEQHPHAPFIAKLGSLKHFLRKKFILLFFSPLVLATLGYWYFESSIKPNPKPDLSRILPENNIPKLRKFMKEYPKGPLRGTAKIKLQLLEIEYYRIIDDARTLGKYNTDSACVLIKIAKMMDPDKKTADTLFRTMRCKQ